jgi:hypothetical protein
MHNVNITTQTKDGRIRHYVVRQMPHDRPVKVGGKYCGETIVAVKEQN